MKTQGLTREQVCERLATLESIAAGHAHALMMLEMKRKRIQEEIDADEVEMVALRRLVAAMAKDRAAAYATNNADSQGA